MSAFRAPALLRPSSLLRLSAPATAPSCSATTISQQSIRQLVPASASLCRRYQTDAGARTTDIPDFSHYIRSSGHNSSRTFQYFVVGSFGALTAVAGKATITDFLSTMSASADVLAMAKVEVDLQKIPEAKNLIIKYSSIN
jgi:ubiquinol-cytochrome c reductase iron-sulfur subunit